MYSIDSIKSRTVSKEEALTDAEKELLLEGQSRSLEWLDKRIEQLVKELPDNGLPVLLIVLADHGEEFGEGGRYGHGQYHPTVMTVPVWCAMLPPK